MSDMILARAKEPLELAKAQQEYELKGANENRINYATEKAKTYDDPSSEASKQAQKVFGLTGMVPPGLDVSKMSANDINTYIGKGPGEYIMSQQTKKAAIDAKKAETDKSVKAQQDDLIAEFGKKDPDIIDRIRGLTDQNAINNFTHTHSGERTIDAKKEAELAKTRTDWKDPTSDTPDEWVKITPGKVETLPPDIKSVVLAIAQGREDVPPVNSRYGARVLYAVNQFNPNYDASKFASYAAARQRLENDPSVTAANTALDHMEKAIRQIPDDQSFSTFYNKVKNWFKTGVSDPEIASFTNTLATIEPELATAYHLPSTNDTHAKLEEMFSKNNGRKALTAAFENQINLLNTQQTNLFTQGSSIGKQESPLAPLSTGPTPIVRPARTYNLKTWKNKNTGKTMTATDAQHKASPYAADWEEVK